MSGRISREFIDDLLVRVDLVDLIDSHVPLRKTGTNYVARCPFHTEKTPSFSVNRNKQFFSLLWLWRKWQCNQFFDGF